MKRGLVLAVVLLLAEALPVRAGAAPPPIPATLADVAFMAGHWVGGDPGDLSEEVWSAPEGDSMMGMWRYVAKGRARIFEVLTLTAEGPNVVLRIRHFDPKLVAREEKEGPVELPLVAKGRREAVFEGTEHGAKGTVRLTYQRGDDDALDRRPREGRLEAGVPLPEALTHGHATRRLGPRPTGRPRPAPPRPAARGGPLRRRVGAGGVRRGALPDALLDCWAGPTRIVAALRTAPGVRWIHARSAGLDRVLVPEVVAHPARLTNGRGAFSPALAEFVLAALLFFAKDLRRLVAQQAAGAWEPFDTERLEGRTVGIVGYGDIGRAVASRLRPLGVEILATRRRPELSARDPLVKETLPPERLLELMARSDDVVVTLPLTPETHRLVGRDAIAAMKRTAVLVNVGRGPVGGRGGARRGPRDGPPPRRGPRRLRDRAAARGEPALAPAQRARLAALRRPRARLGGRGDAGLPPAARAVPAGRDAAGRRRQGPRLLTAVHRGARRAPIGRSGTIPHDPQAHRAVPLARRPGGGGRAPSTRGPSPTAASPPSSRYPESSDNPGGKPRGSVLTVEFEVAGQRFTALNGGPLFVLNPSISFFVHVDDRGRSAIGSSRALADGGEVLMPLDAYPWSERYGWVKDRFGVSWQVIAGRRPRRGRDHRPLPDVRRRAARQGRRGDAGLRGHLPRRDASTTWSGTRPARGRRARSSTAASSLAGQDMVAMDSHVDHGVTFNEALSLQVMCEDQAEVDRYWDALADGGEQGPCGWLKDRFGLSWQVVPAVSPSG